MLTVRLPNQLEGRLADYCVEHKLTKSAAVKRALENLLSPDATAAVNLDNAFVGCDEQTGAVARHVNRLLRERFRAKRARA